MIGPSLIHGDVAYIPLTQGLFAKVDTSDFEWLMQWRWFAYQDKRRRPGKFYAARQTRLQNGRQRMLCMHKALTGLPLTDHRNGDGLDNRRYNLRGADKSLNGCNAAKRRSTSSMFKGVRRHSLNRWRMQTSFRGKKYGGRLYASEELAARAYDDLAKELYGEFALLNFAA